MPFSRLLALALLCSPAWATGYGYSAPLALTGAIGSTQTNITLLFRFSDVKFRTAANGGQIQNTCTRNGFTVPCDFAFTNSVSDCVTGILTGGYTWEFSGNYSATAGTGNGRILVPSYTTSGVTPIICFGNLAVSTYQGGAVGAFLDTNTKAFWPMPDGSTLSAKDFGSQGLHGTVTTATAIAGPPNHAGAAGFASASSAKILAADTGMPIGTADRRVSMWVFKSDSTVDVLFAYGSATTNHIFGVFVNNQQITVWLFNNDQPTGVSIALNTWQKLDLVVSSGAITTYLNGASVHSYTPSGMSTILTQSTFGVNGAGNFLNGGLAEVRVDSVMRTPNWIGTEYNNEITVPLVGAVSVVGQGGSSRSLMGVGK